MKEHLTSPHITVEKVLIVRALPGNQSRGGRPDEHSGHDNKPILKVLPQRTRMRDHLRLFLSNGGRHEPLKCSCQIHDGANDTFSTCILVLGADAREGLTLSFIAVMPKHLHREDTIIILIVLYFADTLVIKSLFKTSITIITITVL